jgi:hypothetical protein
MTFSFRLPLLSISTVAWVYRRTCHAAVELSKARRIPTGGIHVWGLSLSSE